MSSEVLATNRGGPFDLELNFAFGHNHEFVGVVNEVSSVDRAGRTLADYSRR